MKGISLIKLEEKLTLAIKDGDDTTAKLLEKRINQKEKKEKKKTSSSFIY